MLSLPQLICCQKSELAPVTFRDWLKDVNHVYIGPHAARYSGNLEAQDDWIYPIVEDQFRTNSIDRIQYLNIYSSWLINNKYSELDNLFGKIIGCWCQSPRVCHGSIIIKLCKEKRELTRRMVESDEKKEEDIEEFPKIKRYAKLTNV